MNDRLKLMGVFAHPDDESLGNGGVLARYASEGVDVHLLTATRGQAGWFGPQDEYPGPEELGRIRERELRAAAGVLGVKEVTLLDYRDGELAACDTPEAVASIGREIQRVRPEVVLTFDQNGLYGHPDHIAISRLTTLAVAAAAQVAFLEGEAVTFQVPKLYYMAFTVATLARYEQGLGRLEMEVEGAKRWPVPWPDWAVTTRIDASDHWGQALEAIACHRSQLPGYEAMLALPGDYHRELWSDTAYYRALSLVSEVGASEDDFFAGLR